MKKNLFFTFIFCALQFAGCLAQTGQGKILLGISSSLNIGGTESNLMSLGFSSTRYKSSASGYKEPDAEKTTSFNLLPRVGYFVTPSLAVGLDVSLVSSATNENTSVKSTRSTFIFGVGPFARYYVPTGKVLPFFELGTSIGSVNSKSAYGSSTNDTKMSLIIIGGGGGIAAPLGDRLTFDVLLGYNSMTLREKKNNPNNERTVIGTLGFKLGFSFYLGKK